MTRNERDQTYGRPYTDPDADTRAVAARFFDAIECGRIDEVRSIYSPDAVIWHNTDQRASTAEENLEVLRAFIGLIDNRRYIDRRLQTFPGGFVQQHTLTGTRQDGVCLTLHACIVCQVSHGRITRLDEYFDSLAVDPWWVTG